MLTIPAAVASAERPFSKLKLVKTDMSQTRLYWSRTTEHWTGNLL